VTRTLLALIGPLIGQRWILTPSNDNERQAPAKLAAEAGDGQRASGLTLSPRSAILQSPTASMAAYTGGAHMAVRRVAIADEGRCAKARSFA
jgi:hypothetical protein